MRLTARLVNKLLSTIARTKSWSAVSLSFGCEHVDEPKRVCLDGLHDACGQHHALPALEGDVTCLDAEVTGNSQTLSGVVRSFRSRRSK
jgi:hypothetical protein